MRVGARDVHPYRGDFARAAADLTDLARDGWRIVVTTEGPGPGRRIRSILTDASCPAALADNVEARPDPGLVTITTAQAGVGFVAPHLKVAILTEGDLTGRAGASTRDMRRMPSRRRKGVDPLTLHPGDYIVHDQHGIGRFIELVSRSRSGAMTPPRRATTSSSNTPPSKRGQPADRLFVPTDALDQISKLHRRRAPVLTKMGGADWAKTKARAKKAVNEIANELIRLYAARQATKGHAFGPDTPWQRELEEAFPYIETPDQLTTIDEVKADMEKPVPMDRLHLRRRRLRQDRDRRARRVQGRPGRQAGGGARAHHAARHPALRDLRRAVRGLPRAHGHALALPDRRRNPRRSWRAWPRARWTW